MVRAAGKADFSDCFKLMSSSSTAVVPGADPQGFRAELSTELLSVQLLQEEHASLHFKKKLGSSEEIFRVLPQTLRVHPRLLQILANILVPQFQQKFANRLAPSTAAPSKLHPALKFPDNKKKNIPFY